MKKTFWHFERVKLKKKILNLFESEIVQSLILYAPRRIGKTEFLEYDLKPELEKHNYKTLYFSFFTDSNNKVKDFVNFLRGHLNKSIFEKIGLKEISVTWCKVNLEHWQPEQWSTVELLTVLSTQYEKEKKQRLILMLDEVQELQNTKDGNNFVSALRTSLDKNKESLGAIFTGSSEDGLRKIFNDKRAPFFHYGTKLNLEVFDKEFTDFLADKYAERIGTELNKDKLYEIFCKLDKVTEYIRQIITELVLEPDLSLDEAYSEYQAKIFDADKLEVLWNSFSNVEKAIYQWIRLGKSSFYTDEFKNFVEQEFKSETVSKNQIQYALNKLLKNQHITTGISQQANYSLNNTMLTKWLEQCTA